jgi:hypothetical protein
MTQDRAAEIAAAFPCNCYVNSTGNGGLAHSPHCPAVYRSVVDKFLTDAREECAKVAEEFPSEILQTWERLGGPPGNGYRATTRKDIADAIRALNDKKPT